MSDSPLSPFATSWRDAFRDVVLIVLSILIAFWLDAWWDARQEAERLVSLRTALAAEFGENVGSLESDSVTLAQAHAATTALLAEFSPNPDLTRDSLRSLITTSFRPNVGFVPAVGVSATLGPEDIAGFFGDSLGIALARWQRQLRAIESQGVILQAEVVQIVEAWSRIGFPASDFTPLAAGVPESGFEASHIRMLERVEVESLFAARAVELSRVRRLHTQALMIARDVVDRLTTG